ncbi:hypothetical protein NLJ89_g4195 [Agrocybe chaxingu]|uniref:Uncharacterized protein n=1 Tax=Agrocybe chaxingu TaxID=84603 RepID=A0A9W8MY50_9AGAR|nr:hypothetical protein NLJ89_g4195 [Agrocybe chaxingu]
MNPPTDDNVDEALQPILSDHEIQMLYNIFWGKSLNILDTVLDGSFFRYIDLAVNMPTLLHNEHLVILSQYEYFLQRIKAIKESPRRTAGVVLLGNPGIGKSSFLIFMLLHCLVNRNRVVWASRGDVYVLNPNGVFTIRSGTHLRMYFNRPAYEGVLALVDSDEKSEEPDPGLVHSRLFAVHATSPQQGRYKNWVKQRMAISLVMEPPTVDDMHALMSLRFPDCVRSRVEAAMATYGGNSRTIVEVFEFSNGVSLQEVRIKNSLQSLSFSQLEQLIRDPHDGDKNITHALIQSTSSRPPPQIGDPRYLAPDMMVHSFASRYIWKLVYQRFMDSSLQEMRRLFVSLAGLTSAGATRGWIFEAWCHDRLCQAEIALELTEMVRDSSSLAKGVNTRSLLFGQKRKFKIFPTSTRIADTKDTSKYYVPQKGNNPTFDSFLHISDEVGIGFQMTISSDHTLEPKGLRILAQRLGTNEHLFVFVIPTGHSFRCKNPPKHWMSKFKFYTLEVDFNHPVHEMDTSLDPEEPSDVDMDIMDSE